MLRFARAAPDRRTPDQQRAPAVLGPVPRPMPCTDLPDDVIGRNDDGFILTGPCIGADNLLQTTVPGVFAAGDVRSGSTKPCATAVGKEAGPYNSSTPASRHADHPMTVRQEPGCATQPHRVAKTYGAPQYPDRTSAGPRRRRARDQVREKPEPGSRSHFPHRSDGRAWSLDSLFRSRVLVPVAEARVRFKSTSEAARQRGRNGVSPT